VGLSRLGSASRAAAGSAPTSAPAVLLRKAKGAMAVSSIQLMVAMAVVAIASFARIKL